MVVENPFHDGMTPFEFVKRIEPVLGKENLEPWVREILERELNFAKNHSPFATLKMEYDENGTLFFTWQTAILHDRKPSSQ